MMLRSDAEESALDGEEESMNVKRVPRVVALLTTPTDGSPTEAGLKACANAMAERMGRDRTVVRLGVRDPDVPSVWLAQRNDMAPIDAAIEATLKEGDDLETLINGCRGLGRDLEGIADPGTSAVLAGIAYLIIPGSAATFIALAGRRDPRISIEEMRRWWLEQHAVLVQRIVRPVSNGYEQLHVDHELSRRAAEAAGFIVEEYDAFDSIFYRTADEFLKAATNPQVARRLYEDELGHVDHTSFRGAVCRML